MNPDQNKLTPIKNPPEEIKQLLPYSISKFNRRIKQRGYCHGRCLDLMQNIAANPRGNPDDWYRNMSTKRIARYQLLEMLRAHYDKLYRAGDLDAEVKHRRVLQLMPEPSFIIFNFNHTKENIQNNFLSLMDPKKPHIFIVRRWDRKKSHSFLIYLSKETPCFYDSSSKKSFYISESVNNLGKQFINYLQKAHPNFTKDKSIWRIEVYCQLLNAAARPKTAKAQHITTQR